MRMRLSEGGCDFLMALAECRGGDYLLATIGACCSGSAS